MFRIEPRGERVNLLRMDDGKVNAIGPEFLTAFASAWPKATAEGKAVVLVGNAKAFSAGLDLKTLPALERPDLVAFARGFMTMFHDVLSHSRPVVAAVEGPAIAGGAVLALAADLRIVGPGAKLGVTEVPVGIPFPAAVVELVRASLPPHEHAPALLQGAVRVGEACVRTGWAHELSARAVDDAAALAEELAQSYPLAYGGAKRMLRDDVAARFATFAKEEAEAWVDTLLLDETMDAIVRGFARAKASK